MNTYSSRLNKVVSFASLCGGISLALLAMTSFYLYSANADITIAPPKNIAV
jgi:hypothetical protein